MPGLTRLTIVADCIILAEEIRAAENIDSAAELIYRLILCTAESGRQHGIDWGRANAPNRNDASFAIAVVKTP